MSNELEIFNIEITIVFRGVMLSRKTSNSAEGEKTIEVFQAGIYTPFNCNLSPVSAFYLKEQ
jgi:hypothetical protein